MSTWACMCMCVCACADATTRMHSSHLNLLYWVYPGHGHKVKREYAPRKQLDAVLCKGVGKVGAYADVPARPLHDSEPE
jgi:hypothetical protein